MMALQSSRKKDKLDQYLSHMDDPNDWRTLPGSDQPITREELDILYKLQQGNIADLTIDPYSPAVDFFTSKLQVIPIHSRPEPKSRFVPSKSENRMILKFVNAIRKGWIKAKEDPHAVVKFRYFNIWKEESLNAEHMMHIPPPKLKLPGHRESIRPPPEYLPSESAIKKFKQAKAKNPGGGKKWIPTSYDCLRHVPVFKYLLQERFSRCLDLYLCPRVKKNRLQIDPESLVPKLPDPKDLRPFPTTLSTVFKGHSSTVSCLSMDPNGHWIVSGSNDGIVQLWEVYTGRCLKTLNFDGPVKSLAWNPSKTFSLLAVTCEESITLMTVMTAHRETIERTNEHLLESVKLSNEEEPARNSTRWKAKKMSDGSVWVTIHCREKVTSLSWHRKGDYFVTVSPAAHHSAILVHQVSKGTSQNPFKRVEGIVVTCQFHPIKPLLFIASTRVIRLYDLMRQEMIKRLEPGVRLLSSLSIHPKGDNAIIGSLDKQVSWFDLDLSTSPYKSLRFHTDAVRQVTYHQRYPLFASCSDDGAIHVSHGMVYDDLMQNPLIVPVKILKPQADAPKPLNACLFHPYQPWIFSAGEAQCIYLFVPTVH